MNACLHLVSPRQGCDCQRRRLLCTWTSRVAPTLKVCASVNLAALGLRYFTDPTIETPKIVRVTRTCLAYVSCIQSASHLVRVLVTPWITPWMKAGVVRCSGRAPCMARTHSSCAASVALASAALLGESSVAPQCVRLASRSGAKRRGPCMQAWPMHSCLDTHTKVLLSHISHTC